MATGKKIILITGANSGIGFATSNHLAQASSDNHVIMGVRSLEKGSRALSELQARKPAGQLSLLELDVAKDESIDTAVQKLTNDFGVIDVLINNAGICTQGTQATRQDLHRQFNTNVWGPVLLTQALEPLLQKSNDPRIINISSNLGSIGLRTDHSQFVNHVPTDSYRLTKAALNMATATQLWNFKDWEHPAKVFTYCPGYVQTNLEGEGNQEVMAAKGAISPETSAQGILEILKGERDGEIGKFLTTKANGGTWPY